MPLHAYSVQALFIIMGLALFIVGRSISKKGGTFLGKPTIGSLWFYTGKFSLFSGWGFFLFRSIVLSREGYPVNEVLSWIAVGLLLLGTIILVFSFINLGLSLKVGLPTEETKLKTTGIYKYSRNPLYFGVFIVSIASCIYYPNPINLVLSAYGILIHHRITLGEERFLEKRFGKEWVDYRGKVRRYL